MRHADFAAACAAGSFDRQASVIASHARQSACARSGSGTSGGTALNGAETKVSWAGPARRCLMQRAVHAR
jgi:hypothetical protein